jgi:hypothetical protein
MYIYIYISHNLQSEEIYARLLDTINFLRSDTSSASVDSIFDAVTFLTNAADAFVKHVLKIN